jgi:transcriptional regulator with XRE-family HTH domain
MTTQSSPTLRRRRLARRLRQMRENAGMTLAEAAPRLHKTRSALGRIEKGETAADVHLVRSMMDLYDQYDENLEAMVKDAMVPGWWIPYGIKDRGFIGLETEAVMSLDWSLVYIPGLLQTEDYMRAVFSNGNVRWTKKLLENHVAARLIRQERLKSEESPITLAAIIDEAALHKPVGGAAVMHAQLLHLIDAAELDTVTIQVIPNAVGAHRGMDGSFTVLEFQEPEDPSLLHVEYPTGGVQVEKPDEVRDAKVVFDNLRSVALPPADSAAFVRRVADEFYAR